jgi:hypothetical protein
LGEVSFDYLSQGKYRIVELSQDPKYGEPIFIYNQQQFNGEFIVDGLKTLNMEVTVINPLAQARLLEVLGQKLVIGSDAPSDTEFEFSLVQVADNNGHSYSGEGLALSASAKVLTEETSTEETYYDFEFSLDVSDLALGTYYFEIYEESGGPAILGWSNDQSCYLLEVEVKRETML